MDNTFGLSEELDNQGFKVVIIFKAQLKIQN